MKCDHYQVGGSLKQNAPSYVIRQADADLCEALLSGELCYVFNARQMGKSSLRIRTQRQLEKTGQQAEQQAPTHCVSIDMTQLGSEHITPEQWYKSLAAELVSSCGLWQQLNLKHWWQQQAEVSAVRRLGLLVEEILLRQLPESRLFIFIDEIDSLLSLPFPVDDFFAWMRYCYNQRAEQRHYRRLNWALFGVATPSDLIRDRTRTPFNIGRAIELRGFRWDEAQPLLTGLVDVVRDPGAVLREILQWTGGQPFLTQRVCRLIVQTAAENPPSPIAIPTGTEGYWVEQLVRSQLIEHWQTQDQPEHLRTIRDRLLRQEERAGRLLGLYQQVLENRGVAIAANPEQTELLLSGLVEKQYDQLRVKNLLYQEVFNLAWVREHLSKLRPYSQSFEAWMASQQLDESRLLRGQALVDAQAWSRGKQLSDTDYRYLAASEQCDRQEVQQVLEAARSQEIQARLVQQRQVAKLQRWLLVSLSVLLVVAIGLASLAFGLYQQASLSEVKALAVSSNGLFPAHQLDALIAAIKAKRRLQSLVKVEAATSTLVDGALRQVVYGSNEFNRLVGHRGSVLSVAISPDGEYIATGSNDKTVKVWRRDGTLLQTLKQSGTVHRVAFGPDSRSILAGSLDGQLYLWRLNGQLIRRIQAHQAPVWGVAVSPTGQLLASASGDRTVKLWRTDGTLVTTLGQPDSGQDEGHRKAVWAVAFSPDGQQVASASMDTTVKLWRTDGTLLQTLIEHQAPVWDVAFCPASTAQSQPLIASVSSDRTAKLWRLDGTVAQTLKANSALIGVDCQGEFVAASSKDKDLAIKIWKTDGTLRRNLLQHGATIRDVALSRDGRVAASASDDGTAKLWRQNRFLSRPLYRHEDTVWQVATSPDSQWMAAAGDNQVTLWQPDGTLRQVIATELPRTVAFSPIDPKSQQWRLVLAGSDGKVKIWEPDPAQPTQLRSKTTFTGSNTNIYAVAIQPGSHAIAVAGDSQMISLWTPQGQLLRSFAAHNERIWQLAFRSDGQLLASASEDGTVKLWRPDGHLVANLVGHQGTVWGTAFNPTGDRIVTVSRDDTIKLWTPEGTLLQTIPGQSQGLTRVAWSPDGKTIATAGVDNTVKLWSGDGNLLKTLPSHRGAVISLAFTPDGHFLVSGGDDSTVILWDLRRIDRLDELSYACHWVRDYLRSSPELEQRDRSLCDGIQ